MEINFEADRCLSFALRSCLPLAICDSPPTTCVSWFFYFCIFLWASGDKGFMKRLAASVCLATLCIFATLDIWLRGTSAFLCNPRSTNSISSPFVCSHIFLAWSGKYYPQKLKSESWLSHLWQYNHRTAAWTLPPLLLFVTSLTAADSLTCTSCSRVFFFPN